VEQYKVGKPKSAIVDLEFDSNKVNKPAFGIVTLLSISTLFSLSESLKGRTTLLSQITNTVLYIMVVGLIITPQANM